MKVEEGAKWEDSMFSRDLQYGRQRRQIVGFTRQEMEDLYNVYKADNVKNYLCLRIFGDSLFDIASSTSTNRLMYAIFGHDFLLKIESFHAQVYDLIGDTVYYMMKRIHKADIITFRRGQPKHGWDSVRMYLTYVLKGPQASESVIAGMVATILKDVNTKERGALRDEDPLLPRRRFPAVFRVAFSVFNEAIGEFLLERDAMDLYETMAAQLVKFYTRVAADTWRVLVVRNGPKEETEALVRLRF